MFFKPVPFLISCLFVSCVTSVPVPAQPNVSSGQLSVNTGPGPSVNPNTNLGAKYATPKYRDYLQERAPQLGDVITLLNTEERRHKHTVFVAEVPTPQKDVFTLVSMGPVEFLVDKNSESLQSVLPGWAAEVYNPVEMRSADMEDRKGWGLMNEVLAKQAADIIIPAYQKAKSESRAQGGKPQNTRKTAQCVTC